MEMHHFQSIMACDASVLRFRQILRNKHFHGKPFGETQFFHLIQSCVQEKMTDDDIYHRLHSFYHSDLRQSNEFLRQPAFDFSRETDRTQKVVSLIPTQFTARSLLDVGCNEGWVTCEIGMVHSPSMICTFANKQTSPETPRLTRCRHRH